MQKARQEAQHIDAIGAVRDTQVQAGAGHRGSGGGSRSETDDVVATGAEIGSQNTNAVVAVLAQGALPLDAKLGRLVGVDFGNQRFHEYLGAARVELVDHRAQLPVLRLGRRDHQRVGCRVRLNLAASRRGRCGSGCGCIAAGRRQRGWHARKRRPQGTGEFHCVGVFQVNHVNVSTRTRGGRLVQALDQRLHQCQARRVGGPHDQCIAARLGNHHRAKSVVHLPLPGG